MVKKELTPPLTPEEFTRSYAKIENQKGLSLDEIHTTAQKEDIYKSPEIFIHMYNRFAGRQHPYQIEVAEAGTTP